MKPIRLFGTMAAVALTIAVVVPVSGQSPATSPEASAGGAAPEALPSLDVGAAAGANLIVNMKGPGGGNPFWAAVQAGAEEAGAGYGVNVSVISPPAESDVQAQ